MKLSIEFFFFPTEFYFKFYSILGFLQKSHLYYILFLHLELLSNFIQDLEFILIHFEFFDIYI